MNSHRLLHTLLGFIYNFLNSLLSTSSKIQQSTMWYACSQCCWDEWLVDQGSDVPSIIFFVMFLFFWFIKEYIKIIFAQNFTRNHEKEIIVRISDTWSIIHLFQQTSVLYCKLSDFDSRRNILVELSFWHPVKLVFISTAFHNVLILEREMRFDNGNGHIVCSTTSTSF